MIISGYEAPTPAMRYRVAAGSKVSQPTRFSCGGEEEGFNQKGPFLQTYPLTSDPLLPASCERRGYSQAIDSKIYTILESLAVPAL